MKGSVDQIIDFLQKHLLGVSSCNGNVNAALIGTISIKHQGCSYSLELMSSIVQNARRISITPYDPGVVTTIQSTLAKSGFSVYMFSKREVIVTVPLPSGEERKRTIKRIAVLGEDAKISIRHARRKCRRANKELNEESKQRQNRKVDDIASGAIDEVDRIMISVIRTL